MEFSEEETGRYTAIHERGLDRYHGSVIETASKLDKREAIKWLRELGFPWVAWVILRAVQNNSVEQVSWLRTQGCTLNSWCIRWAAKWGYLKMIKWLRSEGCPWDEGTIIDAVQVCEYEIAEWLIRNGCPCTRWSLNSVVISGNLRAVKMLIESHPDLTEIGLELALQWKKPMITEYLKSLK